MKINWKDIAFIVIIALAPVFVLELVGIGTKWYRPFWFGAVIVGYPLYKRKVIKKQSMMEDL